MLYSSRNGCLFYYDSILFRWCIAEPTLLFLLGLEAVTSYDKSVSDSIVISKYVYKKFSDKLEPLEHVHEIYDDIYHFLSHIGSVEDHETYLKFNCYGLKLLLNGMTGTESDRVAPIIFKYDKNKEIIDVKVDSNLGVSKSYYDLKAQKIYDLFSYIGYTSQSLNNYYIDRTQGNAKRIIETLNDSDELELRHKIINSIIQYNKVVTSEHEDRLKYNEAYKLFDYKAMYSYALGVLYGCRCLGFDDSVIWRLDPKFWYNDIYFNLVRTAWHVFRFRWSIPQLDVPFNIDNKYTDVQNNKLWNYDTSSSLIVEPLEKDELNCFCLYLGNHDIIGDSTLPFSINYQEPIIYSQSKQSFLRKYMSLKDGHITWKWLSIDNKVSDGDNKHPAKGVIYANEPYLTRYIGNNKVVIYRAYEYKIDGSNEPLYLAPKYYTTDSGEEYKYKKYYVYTGDLGWVDYTEDLVLDIEHTPRHNYLSLTPSIPNRESLKYAFPNNPTSSSPSVVTYYKCYVTDHYNENNIDPYTDPDSDSDILYGVYNKWITADSGVPSKFDYIISKKLFNHRYSFVSGTPGEEYAAKDYYNLNTVISLVVRFNGDWPYIWDGNTETTDDKLVYYYGYSDNPAELISLYRKSQRISDASPIVEVFRLTHTADSGEELFWSENYFSVLDNDTLGRRWRSASDLAQVSESNPLYRLTNKTANIYKGENILVSDSLIYNRYIDVLNDTLPSDLHKYVYIDANSLLDTSYTPGYDFMYIGRYDDDEDTDSLYRYGVTTHLCEFILTDDNGDSLLDDDGNPLVWYDPDPNHNLYWNGLYNVNKWQVNKPSRRSSAFMYDSATNNTAAIYDNVDAHIISIDGETFITYDEFYSHSNYGIIRGSLQVFNPDVSTTGIKECYYDTKSSPDDLTNAIYCIPTITSTWLTRAQIHDLGWWFVDGERILYLGDVSGNYVFDDDHRD